MLENHIEYVQIKFYRINDMILRIVTETINSVVDDDARESDNLDEIKADYNCLITPVNRHEDSSNGTLYLYDETSPNGNEILWVDNLDEFIIHLNDEYRIEFEKHRALLTTKLGALL